MVKAEEVDGLVATRQVATPLALERGQLAQLPASGVVARRARLMAGRASGSTIPATDRADQMAAPTGQLRAVQEAAGA